MGSSSKVFDGIDLSSSSMSQNIGIVSRVDGLVLILLFILYIGSTIYFAKKTRTEDDDSAKMPVWQCVVYIALGLVAIVAGGQLVVDHAESLALAWGMSETLVGLTIVAVGTSLPELVTSIVASSKGENGMAVGNVVGSNLFNILLILGVSSSLNPIGISAASFMDLAILLGLTILSYFFICTGKKISRWEGLVLIVMYLAYMSYSIWRG